MVERENQDGRWCSAVEAGKRARWQGTGRDQPFKTCKEERQRADAVRVEEMTPMSPAGLVVLVSNVGERGENVLY